MDFEPGCKCLCSSQKMRIEFKWPVNIVMNITRFTGHKHNKNMTLNRGKKSTQAPNDQYSCFANVISTQPQLQQSPDKDHRVKKRIYANKSTELRLKTPKQREKKKCLFWIST